MPSYRARCEKCDEIFEYFSSIYNRNSPPSCECGGSTVRNIEAELASVGSRPKWVTDNPRWSLSMGVPQASLEEYRKRFPNSTYDDRGRLLIKNRKDKLRQIKERDMVELNKNFEGKTRR